MEYGALVAVYRRLEATDANNAKTAILAAAFADVRATADSDDRLGQVVRLVRGRLFAPHEGAELGVSSSLTSEAIVRATGVDPDRLAAEWRDTGDLGSAAAWAVRNRRQQTLFSEPLTVERVYEELRAIAGYEGEGSQERRVETVAGLIGDADPAAARYIVRTALGHMRLGVGEGTVRDAIAEAFLTEGSVPDPDLDLDREVDADHRGDARSADQPETDAAGEQTADGPVALQATEAAVAAVERAYQVTNDFCVVAETARDGGQAALEALDVALGRPVQAMLAQKAEGIAAGATDVADTTADVLAETKYDGARVQLHKDGNDVQVFTRRLEDVTAQFPDVVAAVRDGVDAERAILDGEALGVDPDTREPVPFQEFSRRIKRKYDVEELAAEVPARLFLFDALLVEGVAHGDGTTGDEATDGAVPTGSLLERPLRERVRALAAVIDPAPGRIERADHQPYQDETTTEAFYQAALAAGHEGLMLKNLAAAYEPGRRVGRMVKVKPTMEPLDLVVTRAQWSEGRRSDFLGRLYLACYDADADTFREVGRLSTGYTDEELAALTDRLEALIIAEDGRQVDLRPEVVLEVEYEEIQESPEYDAGLALRFPRFLRVREELAPSDADSYERVRELYEAQ